MQQVDVAAFTLHMLAEISLTGSMCYYLYKSRTGFKKYVQGVYYDCVWSLGADVVVACRTNSLIKTLIKYTINTGRTFPCQCREVCAEGSYDLLQE
jgi:hypothetical protein